ncbi:MAG: CopG family ribbon-helix-helix protein [Thermosphaera sp.]
MKGVKIGIYLPMDLYEEVAKSMKEMNYRSLSNIIQEALRYYLGSIQPVTDDEFIGTVLVIYDHTKKNIDRELTNIQHDFIDLISSTIHVHVDEKTCLLNIIVKGRGKEVSGLVKKIRSLHGVQVCHPFIHRVKKEVSENEHLH